LCSEYHEDVLKLRDYFNAANKATPSMEELNDSYQKEIKKNKMKAIIGYIIGVAGLLAAIIVPFITS
jgi:hypothetical protein